MVFHQVDDPSFFGLAHLFQSMDEWQGEFFLLDIVAKGFADIVNAEVKQIILDLERDAYLLAKPMHLLNRSIVRTGRGCATGTRGGDKGGGLLPANFKRHILLTCLPSCFSALQPLSSAHLLHGLGYDFTHAQL